MASLFHYLLVTILSLLLLSCTNQDKDVIVFKTGDKEIKINKHNTLVVNNGFFNPTFDWNRASLIRSFVPINNVMDGLISYDFSKKQNAIVPAIAEKWTTQNKGELWQFQIRKGIKWSDGKLLKVQHFLDQFFYILNPKNGIARVDTLFKIKNAEKYYKGEVNQDAVGIKIKEGNILEFTLETPSLQFINYLILPCFYPIRLDHVEKYPQSWGERLDVPVTGAFVPYAKTDAGELILKRNAHYFGQKPSFEYIQFLSIEDQNTAHRLFKQGEIDLNFEVPSHIIHKKDPSVKSRVNYAVLLFNFNLTNPLFKSPELRQVFARAINRDELIKSLGEGFVPYRTLYPTISPGIEQIKSIKEEISRADIELVSHLNNHNLKIATWKIPFCQTAAENIQYQLKHKLNLKVDIEINPHKIMSQKLNDREFQLAILPYTSPVEDPSIFYDFAYGEYFGSEGMPKLKQLVEKANSTKTPKDRITVFNEAESYYQKQMPFAPLVMVSKPVQVQDYIKNYYIGDFGYYSFKAIEKNK